MRPELTEWAKLAELVFNKDTEVDLGHWHDW